MVLTAAEFTYRRGSATYSVVAKLETPLAVGAQVLPNIFSEATSRSIQGQKGVGFLALGGDLIVRFYSHDNGRFDFVLNPEGRDGFYPLRPVGQPDVGLNADSSFSSSDHFSELVSQSSDFQSSFPNWTLLTTRFKVGTSRARSKP